MIIGYLISRVERFLIYNEARHMEDTEENEINYLKKIFRYRMGEELDLINPESFNQKIQWLKLYDRNPKYTKLVDKYEVKFIVDRILGTGYTFPTIGVWSHFSDIDFNELPNEFVLKCTHDSGGVVICKNKINFDKSAAKKKLEGSLKNNYYTISREWPYKNVKHRIIAEKYMVDESGYELKDYKFFCFNGIAKVMFIASDRQNTNEETKFDFFDMEFNHLPFTNGHPNSNKIIIKPKSFEKMKKLAEILSEGIPQVRIDFYDINGNIYFGEMTFSHWSGFVPFIPDEWDYRLGSMINLPVK